MDDSRFDALTRSLASTPSRRGLARLFVGVSLGGILSTLATPDAAAGTRLGGEPCTRNRQCKTGKCVGPEGSKQCSCSRTRPKVGCAPPDDPCQKAVCNDQQRCVSRDKCTMQAPGSCGRTGECDQGTCLKYPPGTECGARSCSNNQVVGRTCDADGDCGATVFQTCGQDEECEDAGCKRGLGGDCGNPSDCVSGFCVGERCCQSACTPPNGSGTTCLGGTCTCSGTFQSCNDDGACECDVGAGCESGGEAGTRQCVGSGCVCVT